MGSVKSFAVVVGFAVVVAAAVSGCANTANARYERDDPGQRLAGMNEARGIVSRVDQPQQVVVLDNGQMYRVSGDQAVMVNGQPMVLSNVQPGTPVTIVSGTPVVYQNGQYVVVQGSSVAASPGVVVATPTTGVVRRYGRIADIEGSGNVKVRMDDGSAFEFRPAPGTSYRKGDTVMVDMTVGVAR